MQRLVLCILILFACRTQPAPTSVDDKAHELVGYAGYPLDASSLVITSLSLTSEDIGNLKAVHAKVSASPLTQYYKYQGCNEAKVCESGTFATNQNTLDELPSGALTITFWACVEPQNATGGPDNNCGVPKTTNFQLQASRDDMVTKILKQTEDTDKEILQICNAASLQTERFTNWGDAHPGETCSTASLQAITNFNGMGAHLCAENVGSGLYDALSATANTAAPHADNAWGKVLLLSGTATAVAGSIAFLARPDPMGELGREALPQFAKEFATLDELKALQSRLIHGTGEDIQKLKYIDRLKRYFIARTEIAELRSTINDHVIDPTHIDNMNLLREIAPKLQEIPKPTTAAATTYNAQRTIASRAELAAKVLAVAGGLVVLYAGMFHAQKDQQQLGLADAVGSCDKELYENFEPLGEKLKLLSSKRMELQEQLIQQIAKEQNS